MKRNILWIIVAVVGLVAGLTLMWSGAGKSSGPTMSDTKMQGKTK